MTLEVFSSVVLKGAFGKSVLDVMSEDLKASPSSAAPWLHDHEPHFSPPLNLSGPHFS